MSACCDVLPFQMLHIFSIETEHFPPIKALFELVTSVTLSIFQQGRWGPAGNAAEPVLCLFTHLMESKMKGVNAVKERHLIKVLLYKLMAAGFVESKAAQPQTGKGWPSFQDTSQCVVNF